MDTSAGVSKAGPALMAISGMWCLATSCCLTHWKYKQLAADFPDSEHFRIGINLAWDKLDEYYQRLDEMPIYCTAMALHLAYRWDWFDETWAHKPRWVEKAKEMVSD